VAQLALDDVERHAFAGHLDGVRVSKLMWREAPSDGGADGERAQCRAGSGRRPGPSRRWAVDDTQQRTDRQ
jgi:hypothetical protein